MSSCERCTSPLAAGQCGTCGWVSPAAMAAFRSDPAASLQPPSAIGGPPGRWVGATNVWTPSLGVVSVVESVVEQYLVRFDNGREEWILGHSFHAGHPSAAPAVGAVGLVRFSDGVDYSGRITAVRPARHRVRAADGREQWVADAALQHGPFDG
jgi:hypothetical protein